VIAQLQQRFTAVSRKVQQRIGQRNQLVSAEALLNMRSEQISSRINALIEGKQLLDLFVKSTEQRVRSKYEPIITEALHFIFAQELFFHLYMVNRRNQSEVDFIILRSKESEDLYQQYIKEGDDKELERLVKESKNINYMYGGAVNQVLALMLRFINAELLKIKGPIMLDEPSSAVGEEYSSRLGQLISSMSKRFDRQYILITHSKSLASYAQKSYEVDQRNFISFAKELK